MEAELPLAVAFFPSSEGREPPFVMDEEITPIYTLFDRDRPGPTLKVFRLCPPPRYRVEWRDVDLPSELPAGQEMVAAVTLQNRGNLVWPSEGYNPVRVGYRWLDAEGREVKVSDLRSPLPNPVEPDGITALEVAVAAPSTPGSYTLQLDLVQENFAWFSTLGAEVKTIEVAIR